MSEEGEVEVRALQQMRIESVRVDGRYRRDLGDIEALAKSIAETGLINPITVTSDGRLIAGQRRLEACRSLGWDKVSALVASDLDEAVAKLRAERDENEERKEMLVSERVALAQALEELEKPKAKGRQEASRFGGVHVNTTEKGKVRDIAAKAVGLSSTGYERAGMVVKSANDPDLPPAIRKVAQAAAAEMDATGKVSPAYNKVTDARAGRRTKNRRPITDAARDSGWKLRKEMEKVERIIADDRYPTCREEVATHLRGHLTYTLETAQRLLNTLNRESSNEQQ